MPDPNPRDVYAPTPDWTPPARDDAPTPNQQRDWVPPSLCDASNPYWADACHAQQEQASALALADDELTMASLMADSRAAVHSVPEPSLWVLLALGAAAWRLRR